MRSWESCRAPSTSGRLARPTTGFRCSAPASATSAAAVTTSTGWPGLPMRCRSAQLRRMSRPSPRRSSSRRELAVRSALGATSGRVVAQFVVESAVLVGLALAIGMALSYWAVGWLTRLIPADALARMPFLNGVTLGARALLFGVVTAALSAVVFAVTPLLHVTWAGYREGAAHTSRGSASLTWRRLGSHIVVLELAVAMVLLVGAGLLGRSLHRLLTEDLGLQPDRLATLRIAAPPSYTGNEQLVALQRQLLDR